MNELFKTILSELRSAGGATKGIAALVGLAMLVAVGLTAVVANKPDYQPAFWNLESADVSPVAKALADAGIAFQVSQPPGPFLVFVDDGQRSKAYAAAYGAGALEKPLGGILSDQGVASIFLSNEERRQAVQKREWQETEAMLATLDFVSSARVRTSAGSSHPILGRRPEPLSASVTLRLSRGGNLTEEQSRIVAKLVSLGLGVDPEHLVIADQDGTSLGTSGEEDEEELGLEGMLTYKRNYDQELEQQVDAALERALGPNKAYILVDSTWNFDQSVTRTSTSAKGIDVSVTSVESETPRSGAGTSGGVAGISSNVADGSEFGVENAAVPGSGGTSDPAPFKTKEERKEHQPSTTVDERVRTTPLLERLSVALFVDQSVDDEQLASLERIVSAAVNLDESREDVLTAERLPFLQPEPEAVTQEQPTVELSSGPSPLVETLLSRGVEILTALVFLGLLLKSLKSARRASSKGGTAAAAGSGQMRGEDGFGESTDELDHELLARVQVERLLESDPEKVGEILSSWARGEEVGSGAA